MYSRKQLARDFSNLGIEPGDLLFIHSSFKSLGPVEGGAGTVINALEDVVGKEGLILMPSFNLIGREPTEPPPPEVAASSKLAERYQLRQGRAEVWNHTTTPSSVGWLSEFFRQMPGTYRSDHYSHSVAARGKNAACFVADHRETEGLVSIWDYPPWGATYGSHSPMYKAFECGGKLLMMGTTYSTTTYIHLVEVIRWNIMLQTNPDTPYPSIDRDILGGWWDTNGKPLRARVGDSDCRLFPIRDFIDKLVDEVDHSPRAYATRKK